MIDFLDMGGHAVMNLPMKFFQFIDKIGHGLHVLNERAEVQEPSFWAWVVRHG